ncbi:MAG: type II toxin-antitoxin system HicA family toxin [Proteobacteria bacterium]|nr:type II toxin-antitoxin system HicA family toxin [Pseudomonadota bacterium]
MGSGLYPDLAKRPRAAACHPVRQGKGSHEIWHSPVSGKAFTVPLTVQSRHMANEILKQAGLPKAY